MLSRRLNVVVVVVVMTIRRRLIGTVGRSQYCYWECGRSVLSDAATAVGVVVVDWIVATVVAAGIN